MMEMIHQGPSHGALMALCFVLAVFSGVLLLSNISARREARYAAELARRRSRRMAELLRTVRMAESIAELGIWQYDPRTGEQLWSEGMRELFGVDRTEAFVSGDAETLLFANNIDLVGSVGGRCTEREPFTMHYNIHGFDGVTRSLSVQACNMFNSAGEVDRVVAVVRDVTSEVERERQLELSRASALQEAKQARELAETDPLTGLANRRRIMAELDRMVVAARRGRQPLALVVFDIDHFKAVNDTHGHPAGDKVLKRVAEIATEQSRDGDLVGRVGGEEFVWLVPGANEGYARIICERLRQAIGFGSGVTGVNPVTVSVGFASLQSGDTALSLFARADSALYDAKNSGRNRVRMAA